MICLEEVLKVICRMVYDVLLISDPINIIILEEFDFISTSSISDTYVKEFGSCVSLAEPIYARSNFLVIFLQFEKIVIFI